MAQKFRKKPVVVAAVQLRWDTWSEMCEFASVSPDGPHGVPDFAPEIAMVIPTLEGEMTARENDWIIRGVQGELYPCKPDIFATTYEPVDRVVESHSYTKEPTFEIVKEA